MTARWGPAATIAWTVATIVLFFALQGAVLVAFIGLTLPGASSEAVQAEIVRLQGDGNMLAAASFLTTPLCVAALFGIAKLKRGARIDDSLALLVPPWRVLARWLGAMAVLAVASDALSIALGKPVVPPFVEQAWRSSSDKASLLAAIAIAAPLFEELLFRGFLLGGLERWPRGLAIAAAAGAWATMHTQYDLYGVLTIFAMGLLLGAARARTGSSLVPMAMHALANGWAAAEAIVAASG